MTYVELKRQIHAENEAGEPVRIKTVADALRWIDLHAATEPGWARTRWLLLEAESQQSLRKIRAATRAFEEAIKRRSGQK